jgi:hypothetical protein
MIYQLGDLGIVLDAGPNNPGDVLQRKESNEWLDFAPNGKVVRAPVDVRTLPPGEYRLVSED